MISILKKISPEQFSVYKQWLKNIVKPRLTEELQNEVEEVLEKSNQEEVDFMVSNLGRTIDKLKKSAIETGLKQGLEQGLEKGIEQKAKEIALNAIKLGLDNQMIAQLTGLNDKEIDSIRRENNN